MGVDVKGHQMVVVGARKTFAEAKAFCEVRGQVLATINNEEELLELRYFHLQILDIDYCHITACYNLQ